MTTADTHSRSLTSEDASDALTFLCSHSPKGKRPRAPFVIKSFTMRWTYRRSVKKGHCQRIRLFCHPIVPSVDESMS